MIQGAKRAAGYLSTMRSCLGKTIARWMVAAAATDRLTAHNTTTWWVVFISKNVLAVMLTAAAKISKARLALSPLRSQ